VPPHLSALGPLRVIATGFRLAIEALTPLECPAEFHDFPYGSCRSASLLLGVFLRERGSEVMVVSAGRSGRHWGTHAWLEVGTTVIDITSDQFSSQNARVVVATGSAWHQTWARDAERIPSLSDLDAILNAELLSAYLGLRSSMDPCAIPPPTGAAAGFE
jgi:hypothetical protein